MKKITSLKWKIGRYLLTFGVLVIGMIFLFQNILLKPMYENNRIKEVKSISDSIVRELVEEDFDDEDDFDDDDLEEVIYNSQNESGTCVRIWLAESSGKMTTTVNPNMGCFLYRMKPEEITSMTASALASDDGTYLVKDETSPTVIGGPDDQIKKIIYTRIMTTGTKNAVIMVYTGISPLDSATRTLGEQMWIISLFLAFAVILLTFLMNRQIAKPLSVINENAKKLPAGEYRVDEKTNRYREAQELNETLSAAAVDISKADQAKRDLIANVSHDLRTPLTMISGYGEMMIDLPEEKTDENIRVIVDESKRLNMLVNDLLDLSKLQENQIVLKKTEFDLTALLTSQLRKYDVYTMQDGFTIEEDLCGEAVIEADMRRIGQVINNFMTNAVNYSGSSKRIIVREKINDGKVRVEVQDFGEGIDEKDIEMIWDRYYKIDKTHVRSSSGSGRNRRGSEGYDPCGIHRRGQ